MYIVDILYVAYGIPNHQYTYWDDFSDALEYANLQNIINGEVQDIFIYERWVEVN